MTTNDAIWNTLELQAKSGGPAMGVVRLMVHPEAKCSMYAAVEKPSLDRLFLLRVDRDDTSVLPELPSFKGLTVRYVTTTQPEEGNATLELRLRNREYGHHFAVMVNDLSECAAEATTKREAIERLLQRLSRWQRFFERAPGMWLSLEERRGLFGELIVLRKILERGSSPQTTVILGWRGPAHASHDFEYNKCSIEVKTSGGKQEQRMHISSERQLDWSQASRLLLAHVSVGEETEDGTSLPEMVDSVRSQLADAQSVDQFNDLLLQAGYLQRDEDAYGHPKYRVRDLEAFDVKEGFPCILESDLRKGVGEVTYSIGVGACEGFKIPFELVLDSVGGEQP